MINFLKNLILEKILLRESLLKIPQNVIEDCLLKYEEAKTKFNETIDGDDKRNFEYKTTLNYSAFDILSDLNLLKNPKIFFPYLDFYLEEIEQKN